MNDSDTKKPLIFESMSDLRYKLKEIYNEGGMAKIKKYISEEFTRQRAIIIGGETSTLFDVQLRYLTEDNSGDVILDFKNSPTVKNSMLLMTVNLTNVKPQMQLLIRKEL